MKSSGPFTSMQELYRDTIFRVPQYQRSYAWEQTQWDDLWDDIFESMETDTPHFLGTIVVRPVKTDRRDDCGRVLKVYEVVDGQQRLTTLSILAMAIYSALREQGKHDTANGLWTDFVEQKGPKVELTEVNRGYFQALIEAVKKGEAVPPAERSTNERLRKAYDHFSDKVEALSEPSKDFLEKLKDLNAHIREKVTALFFEVEDAAEAIRTFVKINDRGKPISLVERTKSFMMFYLSRYLHGDEALLQDSLNKVDETFSKLFENFDEVKEVSNKERLNIEYLSNSFREDDFLRMTYHYSWKYLQERYARHSKDRFREYSYDISAETVYEALKSSCSGLKDNAEVLRSFIHDWCDDLASISQALVELLREIEHWPNLKRFLLFQQPDALVYPLLLGLKARGILDETFLRAIEVLDLRVYKVRGTNPKADLYQDAVSQAKDGDPQKIKEAIVSFTTRFGSDVANLRGHVYGSDFVKSVLWRYAVRSQPNLELDYGTFKNCQVERILPENPTFDWADLGFESEEDYVRAIHTLGNLTVLEGKLNERAQNKPPREKAKIYSQSALKGNRLLGAEMEQQGFDKKALEERTEEIIRFVKETWPLP